MSLYLGTTPIAVNSSSRNIGEIITSTIPLTDAGLHLLDGSLISGSGSYSAFVTYMANLYSTAAKISNIKVIGTLTDNNGVISGFSSSNYATIGTVSLGSNFELCFKFTTGALDSSDHQVASGLTNKYIAITINTTNKLAVNIGNGSSWLNPTMTDTSVSANTTYWMKITFDGSRYSIQKSTDGETFNEVGYLASSTVIPSFTLNIGVTRELAGAWNGSIDLNESYININSSRWWSGRNPECFTDEGQWQAAVSTYGVCGKFVYDSVNNTVRLPKITGFTEGTIDPTVLGDLTEAGLPNITGSFGPCVATSWGSGAFYHITSAGGTAGVGGTDYPSVGFNASRSNSIYGNSSTVQPQSIKVLYYIVIATSTKTSIEVDIDEIVTDLNGKADVDLSNVNVSGTSLASSWSMPSSRYINLTLGASGTTYTAPANGWVQLSLEIPANTWINIQMQTPFDGNVVQFSSQTTSLTWATVVPVVKNAIFSINYNNFPNTSVVWTRFRFIYAEGEN
jgi:hypothetical protein